MSDTPQWRLFLLGEPRLTASDGRELRVEGKSLAVLAYLALEGSAPRSRLAGLLWPERTETAARNNLVQLLRRMRSAHGEELVVGQDTLGLSPQVQVDVKGLLSGRVPVGELPAAPLLDGVTFGEQLDLADWLIVQRERLDARRARETARAAARAEDAGNLLGAIRLARRALALDPQSEESHRRLMRVLYLSGEGEGALDVYRQLQDRLRQDLRTEPMPETRELAELIERGGAPTPVRATPPVLIAPPQPPVLIGREAEFARMNTAWDQGKFIIVAGAPGMGKSRLVAEFAAGKGQVLWVGARPGDALVPYTTTIRSLRQALSSSGVELPPDLRRAVSFLLPELAPPGEAPAATTDAGLHGALQLAFGLCLPGVEVCVFDDMQFADDASVEVGFDFIDAAFPMGQPGGLPHFIAVHRENELPASTGKIFQRLVDAGQADWFGLTPLTVPATRTLLASLSVPEAEAEGLARASGGHPLFVLEGVKALASGSAIGRAGGVPPKLSQLIGDRLARLPKMALHAARASAVLGRDFTPELVATMLSAPLLEVVGAWDELETAEILSHDRFHHDLVAEAVLEGIPASVRRLLHRAAARTLAGEGAPPARVAWHWRQGEQDLEAAPWFLQAGEAAQASLRLREAAGYFEEAARIFEAQEDDRAFGAWRSRADVLSLGDHLEARQDSVNDLLERAVTPVQTAQAWLLQAGLFSARNEGARAEGAVRRGLDALAQAENEQPELRAALLGDLGTALWAQGRLADAERALRGAVSALEGPGPSSALATTLSNLAVVLDHQDRHREARELHLRAAPMLGELGDRGHLAVILRNLSVCLSELGDVRGGLDALQRSVALHDEGTHDASATSHVLLGIAHTDLGEYAAAARHYEHVLTDELDPTGWLHDYARACLGEVLVFMGDHARAQTMLSQAGAATLPGTFAVRTHLALARLAMERGEDPQAELVRAQAILGESPRPLALGRVRLVQALSSDPAAACAAAREALEIARRHELGGLELSAQARLAGALLRAGDPQGAAESAALAAHLLTTLEPADVSRGEVLLTIFEVQAAAADPAAGETLAQAQAWLTQTADHLPPALQDSFLAHNRVARRIGQATGGAGATGEMRLN
ncbi:ATP-binding protein [Deinococcus hohokamensis]|uniref:ATP-binding protein n=1 Tax=Deinococcus hohokamensis TaxID=309883 RepID=A0ABV9ICZ1_9DEIO